MQALRVTTGRLHARGPDTLANEGLAPHLGLRAGDADPKAGVQVQRPGQQAQPGVVRLAGSGDGRFGDRLRRHKRLGDGGLHAVLAGLLEVVLVAVAWDVLLTPFVLPPLMKPRRPWPFCERRPRTVMPGVALITTLLTSPVTTTTSASRSQPQLSSASGIGSRGLRKPSEPPWYIRGSVQKLSGISAPRAFRTSSTW